MTISTTYVYILVPLLFVVIPTIILLTCNDKLTKILTTILSVIFFALLFMAITFKVKFNSREVTIIFEYSGKAFDKPINWDLFSVSVLDKLINIAMLFPVGAIVVAYKHKSFKSAFATSTIVGLVLGFTLETLQFCLPVSRSVQFSDVIYNAISVVIGTMYYYLIYKSKKSK